MTSYLKKLIRIVQRIRTSLMIKTLLFMMAIICLGFLGIFASEYGTNGRFNSPLDIFQFLATVSAVGFDDPTLSTGLGKASLIFVIYGNLVFIAIFSAIIASLIIELKLREVMGMGSTNLSNHVVFIGWNRKGPNIVRKLRNNDKFRKRKIVILAREEKKPQIDNIAFIHYERVTTRDLLKKASVEKANTIILLGDYNEKTGADNTTTVNCLLARKVNPKAFIVAEMLSPDARDHLDAAGVDYAMGVAEIGGTLIAGACTGDEKIRQSIDTLTESILSGL